MPKKPEEMTDDELRQAALESFDQNQEPERDEQGRFVKKEEAEVEVPADEEIVYRKVIDLGDGSGVQVFEAPTIEELVDKLAAAQTNATRKIRELAQAAKTAKPAVEPELTAEQKFILQQRVLSEPDKVIEQFVDETFKKKYGPQIEKLEAAEKVRTGEVTAQQWVESTPDYFANERNGDKMKKYLQTYQLDINPENLSKAFEDLNASGLLEARPQEKETDAEPEVETVPVKRIVEPTGPVTVRRKVVGGISTKRSAPVEKTAPGLTEADLYKLSMPELEQLMLEQARRGA